MDNVQKHKDAGCGIAEKVISLAGFMGCGKSTVGKILASRLGADFYDLDTLIEQNAGMTIPESLLRKARRPSARWRRRLLSLS